MKQIWKYKLANLETQIIDMPAGAKILDVQIQNGTPAMWALVDPDATEPPRRFALYGTGWDMPDDPGEYVATFQMPNGLVFHVFDLAIKDAPRCVCCGTAENLHADLGSGGPWRCNSPDCAVY